MCNDIQIYAYYTQDMCIVASRKFALQMLPNISQVWFPAWKNPGTHLVCLPFSTPEVQRNIVTTACAKHAFDPLIH